MAQKTRKRGAHKAQPQNRPPRKKAGRNGKVIPDSSESAIGQTTAVRSDMPIVGIGASAGGIEALKAFFVAVPPDSGMAFVVIQHLEPTHESRMADILAKCTEMKVGQAEDGIKVQANCVYTNVASTYLAIQNGRLVQSSLPKGRGMRLPIDFFLASLAEDQGSNSICIILSGSSAADGPSGVRAIRDNGGICMAQDPKTAQFAAMPQGAIDTGLIDYILPVEQMPSALLAYDRHAKIHLPAVSEDAAPSQLEAILKLLWHRTNSDYHHYKKTTVVRRIHRRMAIKQVGDMSSYLKLLQKDEGELTKLSKDMLIGVSSFFRDTEAFEELRQKVIVPLVEMKDMESPLRIWVPGCATGDEAYSIAMLVMEALAAAHKTCPIQVFASDVDDHALETARAGVYPEGLLQDVSADRLERFFTRQGQSYQVRKQLREAVIFSRQNLITDPPFSKLDLVSCRNVFIYLEPPIQKRVLSLFSFALNTGGYLFLGKSEGLTGMEDVFEPVSKPKRIYRLTKANRRAAAEHPLYTGGRPAGVTERERIQPLATSLVQANQEALLRHFNAAILLVNPTGRILHFSGQTERYLGHPKGLASLNVLDMTAGTLSAKLRRAIEKALQQDEAVTILRVTLPRKGKRLVNLVVEQVRSSPGGGKLLAIVFEDVSELPPPSTAMPVAAEDETLVAILEAEVKTLRNELHVNSEEYDSTNEELKAANEEVMSMNEELQSTNEELEASKEEMQSINEELNTVNSQLSEKLNELTDANNDMANLMSAAEIATVFLDSKLRIKRFTPKATELLNVISSDIGRPISHIAQTFDGRQIAADAENTLKNLSTIEKEVQTRDGRWHTMRILPYRTLDDGIDGVVITFFDVSRLKEVQDRLEHEKIYAESIVETVRDPLIVLDDRLHILSANAAFYRAFHTKPKDTVGQVIYDLGNRQWDIPGLRELLEKIIPKESSFMDFQVEHHFPRIGHRTMLLNARQIERSGSTPTRILLSIEDVTEHMKDRQELEAFTNDLEQRVTERTALADRRAEQLRGLAAELTQSEQRERARLARVLHDNLQQLLVGAKFQLTLVRSHTQDEPSRKAADLMEDLLNQSLKTSRSLTVELSPTILFEAGLDAALPWLARQLETNHGLIVQTDMNTHVEQDEEGVVILLFQAVRELLFNIAKHAKVKSARVQLNRIDGDKVQIIVDDEGVGFDPAKLLAGGPSETGLGLFVIRERLEYLGGQFEIDSAPGQGTRITLAATVRQPLKSARAGMIAARYPADRAEAMSPAVPTSSTESDWMTRVLLVDDHAIVRQGVAGILKHEPNIEVVGEAADGKQAIKLAHSTNPDVIIMDVSMPVMNGIEATRRITAELPGIRVIGLSMYAEADRGEAMREAGAAAYLSKGCPSEDLVAAIRQHSPKPKA